MTKYPLKLKDGFVLRCAASDGDVERLAAFNERVHRGEDLAVLVRALADEPPLPPFAAVQLFFGHRSLPELASLYPDVQPDWREMKTWEILFPVFDSWLNTNY
jgi:hypothetical protein